MKNRIVTVVCLAALLLGTGSVAKAQFRQSIFLDGLLPVGNFASSVSNNAGVPLGTHNIAKAATAGFGIGYRASYRFDIGFGIVAPFASADFFWNFIGDGWSDEYIQAKAGVPSYFNLPVHLGVSYLYDRLWNDVTPYVEFGLGTDLMFIGREKSENFFHTYAYKPSFAKNVSWMIGLGTYFGEHVSVGVYVYDLGKHTIEYTKKTFESFTLAEQLLTDAAAVETRTVGEVALRIGFHF